MHFTHIDHLPSILADGLVADSRVGDRLRHEVGGRGVKDQRRRAAVPLPPGGVVSDYVPFYFAPRSPMMFAIKGGRVPEYGTDTEPLIYLVSTVERLDELGCRMLFTRRNAALRNAEFTDSIGQLDRHVDWALMQERYWKNTDQDGDRRSRRMAECLVPGVVPPAAILHLVTFNARYQANARSILSQADAMIAVRVEPDWYF